MKFFYCRDGPDGDPVLMIGSEINDERLEELQNSGPCSHGELISGNKGLIFEIEPSAAGDLERDLRGFFSRKVSALHNARVVSKPGRREHDLTL